MLDKIYFVCFCDHSALQIYFRDQMTNHLDQHIHSIQSTNAATRNLSSIHFPSYLGYFALCTVGIKLLLHPLSVCFVRKQACVYSASLSFVTLLRDAYRERGVRRGLYVGAPILIGGTGLGEFVFCGFLEQARWSFISSTLTTADGHLSAVLDVNASHEVIEGSLHGDTCRNKATWFALLQYYLYAATAWCIATLPSSDTFVDSSSLSIDEEFCANWKAAILADAVSAPFLTVSNVIANRQIALSTATVQEAASSAGFTGTAQQYMTATAVAEGRGNVAPVNPLLRSFYPSPPLSSPIHTASYSLNSFHTSMSHSVSPSPLSTRTAATNQLHRPPVSRINPQVHNYYQWTTETWAHHQSTSLLSALTRRRQNVHTTTVLPGATPSQNSSLDYSAVTSSQRRHIAVTNSLVSLRDPNCGLPNAGRCLTTSIGSLRYVCVRTPMTGPNSTAGKASSVSFGTLQGANRGGNQLAGSTIWTTVASVSAEGRGLRPFFPGLFFTITVGSVLNGLWFAMYERFKRVLYDPERPRMYNNIAVLTRSAEDGSTCLCGDSAGFSPPPLLADNMYVNMVASVAASCVQSVLFNPFMVIITLQHVASPVDTAGHTGNRNSSAKASSRASPGNSTGSPLSYHRSFTCPSHGAASGVVPRWIAIATIIRDVLRRQGWRGFYNGLLLNTVVCAAEGVVLTGCYEKSRQWADITRHTHRSGTENDDIINSSRAVETENDVSTDNLSDSHDDDMKCQEVTRQELVLR